MYKKAGLLLTVIAIYSGIVYSQQTTEQWVDSLNLVMPGATLKKVSDQFKFTEGPAADKKGNVYFTDQPNDKIWKYGIDEKLSLFMDKTKRSNGLYFDKKGRLIACADEKNELIAIASKRKVSVLLSAVEGSRLNGPNDLWIDYSGGIYFTDPYYQRDYWERKKPELKGQYVYYLPNGGTTPIIVDSTLMKPNGIVGTPDGRHLFVADIGAGKTYRYEIGAGGLLLNRKLFVNMGSDGMTLDNSGNLYLSGKGVTIFDKSGKKIGNIPVPSNWVGNICFGGKHRSTLFITASESVYTVQMQVKGAE
jgi:gluconolactonase